MNFPGGSICSSNRHEFSRRVYMFFEQTRIFQEPLYSHQQIIIFQEARSSPRTPRIFQETLPSPRTHRHFPGRYPGTGWLLSEQAIILELLDHFSESRLNFLQEKVVSKPPYPFTVPRGAWQGSESFELVFFKNKLLFGNESVKGLTVQVFYMRPFFYLHTSSKYSTQIDFRKINLNC